MRENRVKNYDLSFNTPTSGTNILYTGSFPINGEVLAVVWKTNNTGSFFVNVSGTNELILQNKTPSGATWQVSYVQSYVKDNTGALIGSPDYGVNRVVNDPLLFTVSGADGGSITMSVKYR